MGEDGDGEDSTPFWVQSTTNVRHADRLHRSISSVFFSSGLVVFVLLVTALLFFFFILPSSISLTAQIFKPNSVKRSWDSLNIVLVLVAVAFGFLTRNQNEEDNRYPYCDEFQASQSQKSSSPSSSTPSKWYKYNYDIIEGPKSKFPNSTLTRNSSSYPDLRDFSTTHWCYGDDNYDRRRYYDDIHVDSGRVWDSDLDSGRGQLHRRHRSLEGVEHLRAPARSKTVIVVDTLLGRSTETANFATAETEASSSAAAAAAAPEIVENLKMSMGESGDTRSERSKTKLTKGFEPLDPITGQKVLKPPPAAEETPEFTEDPELRYERIRRRKEKSSRKKNKDIIEPEEDPFSTIMQAPPPPPRQKSTYRKRGGATGSSTKDFLNSLYHKKKKRQRQKSIDNLDALLHEAQAPLSFQLPPPSHPPPPPPSHPPPPPSHPPPPPPSVLQNLFSTKKQKRKRTITVTLAPQPQSPPLPPPYVAAGEPEPISQSARPTAHKPVPPQPIKMNSLDKLVETSTSGGESPLNRIPPPPPPPPPSFFKNPAWKFVVQGDYVRVDSMTSSRSGSPDTDDGESDVTPSAVNAAEAAPFNPSPLFCPSPDVNAKAESFITNFRSKLKLEKIHSMKKREVGLSGLGPGPGPSHFSNET
ncbi:hypothetical protein OROHE_003968 [Orobanche hederae]